MKHQGDVVRYGPWRYQGSHHDNPFGFEMMRYVHADGYWAEVILPFRTMAEAMEADRKLKRPRMWREITDILDDAERAYTERAAAREYARMC